MDIKKMKQAVIDALEEIKAKNIIVLNVSKLTSLFDYLVVATGDSNRQTRALANNVKERLKEAGANVVGSEGEETGDWVLVDLGAIVVHMMQPAVRDYYHLEDLWRDGKVEYPKPEVKPAGPRKYPAAGTAVSSPGAKARVKPKATSKTTSKAAPKPRSTGKPATTATTTRVKAIAKPRTKPVTKAVTKDKSLTAVGRGKSATGTGKSAATTRTKKKA